MAKTSNSRTVAPESLSVATKIRRSLAAGAAVVGVYFGGFLWQEVSPAAYSVVFLVLASLPLLLKFSFWKKILLLFPLLILRVVGKIVVKVFGLKAMGQLFRRYGLLEVRYNKVVDGFNQTRITLMARWNGLARSTQAHLILTFLPLLIVLALAMLLIELVRLRVLRMVVEKILQKGMHGRIQQGVDTIAEKVKRDQARSTSSDSGESDKHEEDESGLS